MKNRKELHDQDVIRLLERWGERTVAYPPSLQSKRRSAFLAAGASFLALGVSKAHSLAKSLSAGRHAAEAPMTVGMKITIGFLSTLILAVGTYLGVTIYDELRVEDGTATPTAAIATSTPLPNDFGQATPSGTLTATPSPTGTLSTVPTQGGGSTGAPNATPTSIGPTPTKPGYHYGQTKTPKPPRETKTPRPTKIPMP